MKKLVGLALVVMDTLSWISGVYGPRLTGSPTLRQAGEWARDQLTRWVYPNQFKDVLKRWFEIMPSKVTFGSDAFPIARGYLHDNAASLYR